MFLIKLYQGSGAAIASVVSETLVTIITFLYARKCLMIRIVKEELLKSSISCCFMGCVLLFVRTLEISSILLLFIEVILGTLIYFLLTLGLGHTFARELKRKIVRS